MSSYSDNGKQKVLFRFETPLNSDELNTIFENIINPGVYSGMALSSNGPMSAKVAPGTVVIPDSLGSGQLVVVTTASDAIVTGVSDVYPYICMRYEYRSESKWYAEFFAATQPQAYAANVVILGRVATWTVGPPTNTPGTFDTNSRFYGNRVNFEAIYGNLRIVEIVHSNGAPDPGDRKVRILADGQLVTTEGVFPVTVADIAALTFGNAHATYDRYDVVAVDTAGAVSIIAGTAVASPVIPSYKGYYPLAAVKIHGNQVSPASAGAYFIFSEDITDLRQFMGTPSDYLDFAARGYVDTAVKSLSGDWNTVPQLKQSGKYVMTGSQSNYPPIPGYPGIESTYLVEVNSDASHQFVTQEATDVSDGIIYFRVFTDPIWSAWGFKDAGYDAILEGPVGSTQVFVPIINGPAIITIVGGGGGGGGGTSGSGPGGGGGGGHVVQIFRDLVAGYAYNFVIGGGGVGSNLGNGSAVPPGIDGGTSIFDNVSAAGGIGGGGAVGGHPGYGGAGGAGGGAGGGGSVSGGAGDSGGASVVGGGSGASSIGSALGGSGGGRATGQNGVLDGAGTVPPGAGRSFGNGAGDGYGGGGGGAGYGPNSYGGFGGSDHALTGANGSRGGGGGGGGYNGGAGAGGNGVIYIKYCAMQF